MKAHTRSFSCVCEGQLWNPGWVSYKGECNTEITYKYTYSKTKSMTVLIYWYNRHVHVNKSIHETQLLFSKYDKSLTQKIIFTNLCFHSRKLLLHLCSELRIFNREQDLVLIAIPLSVEVGPRVGAPATRKDVHWILM